MERSGPRIAASWLPQLEDLTFVAPENLTFVATENMISEQCISINIIADSKT